MAGLTPLWQGALPAPAAGIRLYTADGARKYITAGERDTFLREAEPTDRQVRTLCMTLTYAGCRLSKALALTIDRVDLAAGVLVVRHSEETPEGPLPLRVGPPALLGALDMVHGVTVSSSGRRAAARDALCGFGRGRA